MASPFPTTLPRFARNVATNMLQYAGFQPAFFVPHRRSIGGIMAQVTIDEQASDDVQITEHPVEQGAPIADHAFKRPAVVTIRAGWTRQYAWDLSAESGVYGLLLSWQASLLPFDVYTGKRHYTNMLIERLQVTTDNHSEFALMATIACRQVIIVSTATTNVKTQNPSDGAQSNPEKTAGEKNSGSQSSSKTGESTGTVLGTTNEINVEQLSTPQAGTPLADQTIEGAQIMSTPEAQTVEGSMVVNSAAPPNNPKVEAYGGQGVA